MIEKKEKCTSVRLKIGSKEVSGSLCKVGEKLEFKPADKEELKKL